MSNLWTPIEDSTQLTELLDFVKDSNNGSILILKHSPRCAISSMAKRRLESKVYPQISYFLIDVLKSRQISLQLADITGVEHESPQAFLYCCGSLKGYWSHMDIRPATLNTELA